MKIYIYSYINKITGNRYIGKTNNIDRRKREHLSGAFNPESDVYDTMWSRKIREYGMENFDFKILEVVNEKNWSDREIYWIGYYNTFNGAGYNSTAGGDSNENLQNILSKEEAQKVRQMLLDGKDSSEIRIAFDISATLVSNINQGQKYVDESISYPIQTHYRSNEEYAELIHDLRSGTDSFLKLSQKYGFSEATVKKINYGTLRHGMSDSYPIRKVSGVKQKANHVKELLINSDTPLLEIVKLTGVSIRTVKRINVGETHFEKELSYPLRKPVSTIA